ncbi:MAG: hypothetical protein AAFX93_03430 [Verrucomicrobiota bacterium]
MPASFADLQELRPPGDRSWADPFPIIRDERCWIFFEEVIHHPKKGRLAVMELFADGSLGAIDVILDKPYHLSYPFVFEFDGAWWMIPESRQNRTVDLYRCEEWPAKWAYEKTIISGEEIVDATLWEHGGCWWLFGGVPEQKGGNASGLLDLFWADSPLSDQWTPHPQCPVIAGNDCSRPAGKVFRHDGKLIRPAQDCSVRYGYAVKMMQIEELTPDCYRETEIQTYLPDFAPGLRATHTFNRAEDWLLADGARRIWPG